MSLIKIIPLFINHKLFHQKASFTEAFFYRNKLEGTTTGRYYLLTGYKKNTISKKKLFFSKQNSKFI